MRGLHDWLDAPICRWWPLSTGLPEPPGKLEARCLRGTGKCLWAWDRCRLFAVVSLAPNVTKELVVKVEPKVLGILMVRDGKTLGKNEPDEARAAYQWFDTLMTD